MGGRRELNQAQLHVWEHDIPCVTTPPHGHVFCIVRERVLFCVDFVISCLAGQVGVWCGRESKGRLCLFSGT